jgi:hypothetical protein
MERPGGTEINWDGKQTHQMKLKMNSKPRGEGMGMEINNWAGQVIP